MNTIDNIFYKKYKKYKNKYLNLKNKEGGAMAESKSNIPFPLDDDEEVTIGSKFNFSKEIIMNESLYNNDKSTINTLHHYNKNDPTVRGEGVIFGHGSQIPELFCIIPNNIILRPTTKSGTVSHRDFYERESEDLENLYNRTDREFLTFANVYQRYYFPSSLIPNLLVTFKSTYPENNSFSLTGIVTGNINRQEKLIKLMSDKSEEQIKSESLKYHNSTINLEKDIEGNLTNGDIWGKTFYLSDILNAISKHIKQNGNIPQVYILQICRSYPKEYDNDLNEQFCNNYVNYTNFSPTILPPSIGLLRMKSAGEIMDFMYFREKYNKLKQLIQSKNEKFIENFLNSTSIVCKSDNCIGPYYNCRNCDKTCTKILNFFNKLIQQIDQNVERNLLTYNDFCVLNHIFNHKIPFEENFSKNEC